MVKVMPQYDDPLAVVCRRGLAVRGQDRGRRALAEVRVLRACRLPAGCRARDGKQKKGTRRARDCVWGIFADVFVHPRVGTKGGNGET